MQQSKINSYPIFKTKGETFFNMLNPTDQDKFKKNVNPYRFKLIFNKTYVSFKDFLSESFIWKDSNENEEYWREIAESIQYP